MNSHKLGCPLQNEYNTDNLDLKCTCFVEILVEKTEDLIDRVHKETFPEQYKEKTVEELFEEIRNKVGKKGGFYPSVGIVEDIYNEVKQQVRSEVVGEVMPYLKSYLMVLESDWQLHPVQAVNAIYISPEGQLQNQLDALKRKRETENELKNIIKKLGKE